MIEPISAIGMSEDSVQGAMGSGVKSTPFVDWMEKELERSNEALNTADVNIKKLASGEQIALHDVMFSIEDARLQFQLLTQIRSRVLEAYQDLLRMQI